MANDLSYRCKAGRGVTQGGPLPPKIFNVMVDAIVREWLLLVLEAEYSMPESIRCRKRKLEGLSGFSLFCSMRMMAML